MVVRVFMPNYNAIRENCGQKSLKLATFLNNILENSAMSTENPHQNNISLPRISYFVFKIRAEQIRENLYEGKWNAGKCKRSMKMMTCHFVLIKSKIIFAKEWRRLMALL